MNRTGVPHIVSWLGVLSLSLFLFRCTKPVTCDQTTKPCPSGQSCVAGACKENTENTGESAKEKQKEKVAEKREEKRKESPSELPPDPPQERSGESFPDTVAELVYDSGPPEPEPLKETTPEPRKEVTPEPDTTPDQPPKVTLPTWKDDYCKALSNYKPGFAGIVNTWTAQDKLSPPPPDGLVVIGSSSIRFWKTLQKEFSAWQITQRGFGGSRLIDVALLAEKLILPYKPRAVMIFAGTNDIAGGVAPATVMTAYRCLVQKIQKSLGDIPILFIGITPTPSRWARWSKSNQVNTEVKQLAAKWSGLTYIDTPSVFLKTGQPPDASLFVSDRLHLSVVGYTLWNSVVKPALTKAVPPKTYTAPTPQPNTGTQALVDLGPSDKTNGHQTPVTNGRYWNNWRKMGGGTAIWPGEVIGLKTVKGVATPWRLLVSGQMNNNGLRNGGLKTPDPALLGPLAVGTATQDYFYVDQKTKSAGFVLAGLSPFKTYTLKLFASRESNAEVRETRYVITGASVSSQTLVTTGAKTGAGGKYDGNNNKIVILQGLQPDKWGKLHIEIVVNKGSYGYLSLLELTVE